MSPEVHEFRLNALEESVAEIRAAVKSIDSSLQTLARLEERHQETRDGMQRMFATLEAHDERLKAVELEMPLMKLLRMWGFGILISAAAAYFGLSIKG